MNESTNTEYLTRCDAVSESEMWRLLREQGRMIADSPSRLIAFPNARPYVTVTPINLNGETLFLTLSPDEAARFAGVLMACAAESLAMTFGSSRSNESDRLDSEQESRP